jgi:hypothetical protein
LYLNVTTVYKKLPPLLFVEEAIGVMWVSFLVAGDVMPLTDTRE